MTEVTQLLSQLNSSDPRAAEQLLPLVYQELRALAAHQLAGEAPGQTLQPTALVHEAWLRLQGTDPERAWQGRRHFFAAAALAINRILVDRARQRQARRHGGGLQRVDLEDLELAATGADDEVLAVNDALEAFAKVAPEKAELIRLRYFVGLPLEEASAICGISPATAKRHWNYARAWLREHIQSLQ